MNFEQVDAVPGFEFWREGCHAFAKNTCRVLMLAGAEDTAKSALDFIRTLPRRPGQLESPEWRAGFCQQCLEKAYAVSPEGQEAVDYFLNYFPDRSYLAQSMLIDSFLGFMCGGAEGMEEHKLH